MRCAVQICAAVILAVVGTSSVAESAANGGRVYNGYPAKAGQFPYQALIIIKLVPSKEEVCGGSIINNKYILTAGHCFREHAWSSATVYLGMSKLGGRIIVEDKVTTANVIVHPRYNSEETMTHDLALIRLNKLIPLSRYPNELQAVLLPNVTSNGYVDGIDPSVFDNMTAVVSGWGKTNDSANSLLPTKLQYQNVNIMPHDECEEFFRENTTLRINNAHICSDKTLSPSAGPCQGDSGGPLALKVTTPDQKINTYLLGVVSFNYAPFISREVTACINPNPAVYVNVAYHVPWIYTVFAVAAG